MLAAIIFLLCYATISLESDHGSHELGHSTWNRFHHETPDKCKMNEGILNPRNIATTRIEIEKCFDTSADCSAEKDSKYRTLDGSCNNLQHPWWGKSYTCHQRILPYDYGDGISYPRMSCTGNQLPNPRLVSNVFHKELYPLHDKLTTHSMEWGQMIAHDLSLNPTFRVIENGLDLLLNCCENGPVYDDRCVSSPYPPDETFYTQFGLTCHNFVRTLPCQCESGNSEKRNHLNQNTGYHDLSLTYGSNSANAADLRSFVKGMLNVSYNKESGEMPPVVAVEENCVSPQDNNSCYHTGDPRTNQTPFLLTVHVYLLRYHNFICQELSKINPDWDDEKLYQEARRINIAVVQRITYWDYLRNILGEVFYTGNIAVRPGAEYTKYDPTVDATVIDEYAAFAQRYGHTLIPGPLTRIDPKTNEKRTILLRDNYYNPYNYQFDETAEGMTADKEMEHDRFLTDDVRNYLYRRIYLNESIGDDLAAVSVIRGRDHGLPGYVYYLAYFFNDIVDSFDDLRGKMSDKSVDLLQELYESVYDIDVYTAGLAEYHVRGGIVGRTIAAVLMNQYRRTKFGDRLWFEHGNEAGSFSPEQLQEIKRGSLAAILCEVSEITVIQEDPFKPPSFQNPSVPCELIHKFDFSFWKE